MGSINQSSLQFPMMESDALLYVRIGHSCVLS